MKDRIEAALGAWGRWVAAHPWPVIFVVLVLTGALGTQIQHFYLETSNDACFHKDDPIVLGAGQSCSIGVDSSGTPHIAYSDNDGHPDLFLGRYKQPNALYLNNGDGTFRDASASSGHSPCLGTGSPPCPRSLPASRACGMNSM